MVKNDAAATAQEAYFEICADTMSRMDSKFIHQHVVDAFFAGEGNAQQKPIGIWFALVGLCLHLEYGLDGRQVQRAHMALAKRRRDWPELTGRLALSGVTVHDVAAARPEAREALIDEWCNSVWSAWAAAHREVRSLAAEFKSAAR